jgi:hypothetical protein
MVTKFWGRGDPPDERNFLNNWKEKLVGFQQVLSPVKRLIFSVKLLLFVFFFISVRF